MADEALQRQLLRLLGRLAVRRVRPRIKSALGKPIQQLQKFLEAVLVSDRKLVVRVPHYWAVYVHDGRSAPFGPRRATFLIWFKDPKRDPRLINGETPQRAASLRRLSKAQFRAILKEDREARNNGRPSPVVITRKVRKPTPPSPFFANEPGGGMFGFVDLANQEGTKLLRAKILSKLRKELGVSTFIPSGAGISVKLQKDTARLTI